MELQVMHISKQGEDLASISFQEPGQEGTGLNHMITVPLADAKKYTVGDIYLMTLEKK